MSDNKYIRFVFFVCLLIFLPGKCLIGQDFGIGLHANLDPVQVMVSCANGAYSLTGDSIDLGMLAQGKSCYISFAQGLAEVRNEGNVLGTFKKLEIRPALPGSYFKLLCLQPSCTEHWYEGGLLVKWVNGKSRMINTIDPESYIAGVIEAETGSEQELEFYKAQAMLCRTFALANYRKHHEEGFNLCDQVHCQAYKGRPHSNPDIITAVASTKGLILVDRNLQLIDAVFHSNCGGQTHNAEEYWREPVAYLRSVKDTFCLDGQQVRWDMALPKEKWLLYLSGTYGFPVDDPAMAHAACNYNVTSRSRFFLDPGYRISMRALRSDWNLRSTFFDIREEGDMIRFEGRGFGHGVGLCQEGAMNMARHKYTYSDILHFYYKDIFLVPKDLLGYLKGF